MDMNVSPTAAQNLHREFDSLFSTQLPPLGNQIPVIAKGVAMYAQAFFDRRPVQEQQKISEFFKEWGELRELESLPTMTLNKIKTLKELIQQLSGCTIVDMGEWSMRPLYLFKITSSQRNDVKLGEDEFNKLAEMQQSNPVSVIAISESSWKFLNDWALEGNRR